MAALISVAALTCAQYYLRNKRRDLVFAWQKETLEGAHQVVMSVPDGADYITSYFARWE